MDTETFTRAARTVGEVLVRVRAFDGTRRSAGEREAAFLRLAKAHARSVERGKPV